MSQNRLDPAVTAAGSMIVAALATGAAAFLAPSDLVGAPVRFASLSPAALYSVLTLGVLNAFAAYLIIYALIAAIGSARTSLVTYIIPAVGLLLGVLFLDEPLDLRLIAGAVLIVGSVAVVNRASG